MVDVESPEEFWARMGFPMRERPDDPPYSFESCRACPCGFACGRVRECLNGNGDNCGNCGKRLEKRADGFFCPNEKCPDSPDCEWPEVC